MMKSQQLVFCIAMALVVGSVKSPVFPDGIPAFILPETIQDDVAAAD